MIQTFSGRAAETIPNPRWPTIRRHLRKGIPATLNSSIAAKNGQTGTAFHKSLTKAEAYAPA